MTDKDDYRIDGTIERVGFYGGTDPKIIEDIEKRQRMYEHAADRWRKRKNIPFGKVLRSVRSKQKDEKRAKDEKTE